MLTVDEALARLLDGVRVTGGERVSLANALGRVPAVSAVVATIDVPPFANSAMDGYALRSVDGDAPRRVVGESRAGGSAASAVEAGTATRITTGAPVPEGADTIVPVEEATEQDGMLVLAAAPSPGTHVRPAALDIRAGQSVALPPLPLSPSAIGLLGAMGFAGLEVRRRPRVPILSTGDELRDVGASLGHGQIYDANAPALAAAVTEAGGEPVILERAPDQPDVIERTLGAAVEGADLLIASGGVSVGEHDHVRGAIERLGSMDFWRIAVQPGKPLAFGRIGDVPVIGLPGNPVSALVTFELFARPMLRAMLGLAGDGRFRVAARVADKIGKDPARRAYLRVRIERSSDGYAATSAGGQGSSQLLPLASANGLLVVPEGIPSTEPGALYEAILLGGIA